MKKIFSLGLLLMLLSISSYAQTGAYELGAKGLDGARRNMYGGFYDYSDPEAVNISVSVWGFVKYPGKYQIPDYTSVIDLMSFVGGPTDDSNLDELRIYRLDDSNNERMIPIDFNDLMWEDGLDGKYRTVPQLRPSDILVVPGEPRMYFVDWLSLGLMIVSALSSLSILIITIR